MAEANEAKKMISSLIRGRIVADCPCCDEQVLLRDAGLFFLDDFSPEADRLYQQAIAEQKERQRALRDLRKRIPAISQLVAKATNLGRMLERLAPSFKTFRFQKNDCRSIFDPIDYVIFEGLSLKGIVSKIFFIDVKSGNARLNARQREIKNLVGRKKVSWHTYAPEVSS